MAESAEIDYSLSNPDTLTKYKTAATISNKVLDVVLGWCVEGAKVIELCQKGDALLGEEIAKVYKGKKISKGIGHPTTVSPSSFVTPYTPLVSDTEEANTVLKAGEVIKVQLGAQIDGFGTIVCDSIAIPTDKSQGKKVTGRDADLLLACYWANELLLRLMVPPGLLAGGNDEEKKKAALEKPPTQTKITQLLEKVTASFDCHLVEGTTCWLFEHNDIEGKKKIILAPGDGVKGEGIPEVGEVWGVEMGVSLGSGKCKNLPQRTTLLRRTNTTYQLKRPSSRSLLSEIVQEFKTFPFSLRQLKDEKAAKVGVVECVRSGVLRAYEVVGEKDDQPVARLFSTIAITKNGLQLISAPPKPDLGNWVTDKKLTEDPEIAKILERPLARSTGAKKNKKKKKKPAAKKAAAAEDDEDDEDEDSDEE